MYEKQFLVKYSHGIDNTFNNLSRILIKFIQNIVKTATDRCLV